MKSMDRCQTHRAHVEQPCPWLQRSSYERGRRARRSRERDARFFLAILTAIPLALGVGSIMMVSSMGSEALAQSSEGLEQSKEEVTQRGEQVAQSGERSAHRGETPPQGGEEAAQTAEGTWYDPIEVAAVAQLYPTEGYDASGIVLFIQEGNAVRIVADIENLSPGEHGFHIHQFGDCTAADATSAGGHYAPYGNPHGAPWSAERHVGDLGNIVADEDGAVSMERVDEVLRLSGPHSIIGRAVVVHAQADDYVTQPSGAAGARVACGVIGLAEHAQEVATRGER